MTESSSTPAATVIDLLARLGVSINDLNEVVTASARQTPTFAEYVPIVAAAVGDGTRRVYNSYWDRILAHWADRHLDEPTPTEIQELAEHIRAHVVVRRNHRGGHNAAEHLLSALRCVYSHAIADGHLSASPAHLVAKPYRRPSDRGAIPHQRLVEINDIVATTGDDPALDTLIVRLHTESACRRGGALALRPCDLDPAHCLVRLREKADSSRWQPVSPTLMRHLQDHAEQRNAPVEGQLLRYSTGKPIATRRYDYIWRRVGQRLPWAAAHGVTAHWLRHTTLTWVERNFGYATARAYAGHAPERYRHTTITYTKATIHDVTTALAALTGEPHPLQEA